MTTMILALAACAAALLALLAWWIRRDNLAVYPVGRQPRELRPLPVGCELGAQLLASTATGDAPAPSSGPAAAAQDKPQEPPKRPTPRRKAADPDRRKFLRTSWLLGWVGTLSGFSAASLAFLWPDVAGGFGARIRVGAPEEIVGFIRENAAPFAFPSGRMYLIEYNESLDPDGQYADITDAGLMALYHKCVHLGCKVPWCQSSQWFECPCHGSRYNRWGEYKDGPAPRGLDRFPVVIEEGQVVVDTGQVITGPSRQAVVLDQEREGPSCL